MKTMIQRIEIEKTNYLIRKVRKLQFFIEFLSL